MRSALLGKPDKVQAVWLIGTKMLILDQQSVHAVNLSTSRAESPSSDRPRSRNEGPDNCTARKS